MDDENVEKPLVALDQLLLEGNVFIPQRFVGQNAFHEQRQFIRIKGLAEIVHGPALHGLYRRLDGTVGSHHDHHGIRLVVPSSRERSSMPSMPGILTSTR